MISNANTLELYLKLDHISSGRKLKDFSDNQRDATLNDQVFEIVSDNFFGKCLQVSSDSNQKDTQTGISILPESIPMGKEISISFWACGGDNLFERTSILQAELAASRRFLLIQAPWDHLIIFDCGNNKQGAEQVDRIETSAPDSELKGRWYHWTFTKDIEAGEMKIFLNGQLRHSNDHKLKMIKTLQKPAKVQLCPNYGYQGRLAHFRIYSHVLSDLEIRRDMVLDLMAGLEIDPRSLTSILSGSLDKLMGLNRSLYEEIVLELAGKLDEGMREKVKEKFREFQQDRNWESIKNLFELAK